MDRIEKLAHSLKLRYKTDCPCELCESMNIKVLTMDLPESVHGFFLKLFKNYVIVLSSCLSQQNSAAVCAHELGHILLHGSTNALEIQSSTYLCLPRYEHEADYFAACLLLDEDTLPLHSMGDTVTAADISALTGVPEALVLLRFERLTKKASA